MTRPHPRVVFVSRQRLVGPTNGSSTYLLDLASAVRAAGLVPHLIQPSSGFFGRIPVLRLKPAMRVFASHEARGAIRLGATLLTLDPRTSTAAALGVLARLGRRAGLTADWTRDRKAPHAIAAPWTKADLAYVRRRLSADDIVIADYMFQIEALRALDAPPRASAIVMHDLYHARAETLAGTDIADSIVAITRDTEAATFARADAVIAIQDAEAAFVRDAVPATRAILTPMSYRTVDRPQPGRPDRLLFVGSNTPPNVVGLEWFLKDAWPAIRAARPAATLAIAGTVARAFVAAPPEGVTFLGLVDDLEPLYAEAGVVISPLTYGSGLKVKLIEALARGKAIVATGITLQGVEAIAGSAVVQADKAEAFAAAVVALCVDEGAREALAERALAVARHHFSPEAAHADFIAWLREKAGGPGGTGRDRALRRLESDDISYTRSC